MKSVSFNIHISTDKKPRGIIVIEKGGIQRIVIEWLPFIYVILNAIIRLVNNNRSLLLLCLASLIVAGVIGIIKSIIKLYAFIIGYIGVSIISWMLCYLTNDGWVYDLDKFIYSLMYMGMAAILLEHRGNTVKYKILYFAVSVYIAYNILIKKVSIRGFMLDGSTYNYISVICLFYLALLGIMKCKNNEKITYLEVIPFLVITFTAYGRGGIVAAVILLIGTIIISMHDNRKRWTNYIFVMALIVIFAVFGHRIITYIWSNYMGKFLTYGFDNNGRTEIWAGFLKNNLESVSSFLFGSNPMKVMVDGNLHNSFLQLYAAFGLVFLLINLYLIIKATTFFIRSKDLWLVLIFVVVFTRSLTDMVFFRGYCEIIYYYYIFKYLVDSRKKRQDLIL